MNRSALWVLYLHELRSALRERNIVVYSLLIPAILYPLLIWIVWTASTFVSGQNESQSCRIALPALSPEHAALEQEIRRDNRIEIITNSIEFGTQDIKQGRADAVLSAIPHQDSPHPAFTILYDGSIDKSRIAKERLAAILERYRSNWLEQSAGALNIPPSQWKPYAIEMRNQATGRDMGAFLMKLVVPLLMLIMTAMGCFYPAVDAIAGERERSTWETLMATAATRPSILLAKYLYVATFGCAAGLLNLMGMGISLTAVLSGISKSTEAPLHLSIPLKALPLMILCAILIALFIAAVMLLLASFARTFKEGQAMITPFYLMIALPAILLQSPDLEMNMTISFIPLANVIVLFRDALSGHLKAQFIGITIAVQMLSIALCLSIGRKLLTFEDFLSGTTTAAFKKILRKGIFGS